MDPATGTLSYELLQTSIAMNWYQMMTLDVLWIIFACSLIVAALVWRNRISELFK